MKRITETLKKLIETRDRQVIAITGAGGEGKSIALRQIICDLVDYPSSDITVIWRDGEDAISITKLVEELTNLKVNTEQTLKNSKIIIAIDNANVIFEQITDVLKMLQRKERSNFHFLLCAKSIDWAKAYPKDISHTHLRQYWSNLKAIYKKEDISGLSSEDAQALINAWKTYDDKGWIKIKVDVAQEIGRINQKNAEAIIEALTKDDSEKLQTFRKTLGNIPDNVIIDYWLRRQQTENLNEDFLGSMLRIRYGDRFQDHISEVLYQTIQKIQITGLSGKSIDGYFKDINNAIDIYTYVAIVDAYQIQYFRQEIFQCLLGIANNSEKNLWMSIITRNFSGEIKSEPTHDKSQFLIKTRNSTIAQASLDILKKNQEINEIDITQKLCNLVEVAILAWRKYGDDYYESRETFNIIPWNELPNKFAKENPKRAIAIAKRLLRIECENEKFLNKLASLYRVDRQFQEAIDLFKKYGKKLGTTKRLRSFYNEWYLSAKELALINSNQSLKFDCVSLYMYGVSIADYTPTDSKEKSDLIREDIEQRLLDHLKKVSKEFSRLSQLLPQESTIYEQASQASMQLHELMKTAQKNKNSAAVEKLFNQLEQGFNAAYKRGISEIPEWVFTSNQLTFQKASDIIYNLNRSQ